MIPEERAKRLIEEFGIERAKKEVEKELRMTEVNADTIGKAMEVWYWERVMVWLERLKDEGYAV